MKQILRKSSKYKNQIFLYKIFLTTLELAEATSQFTNVFKIKSHFSPAYQTLACDDKDDLIDWINHIHISKDRYESQVLIYVTIMFKFI